MQNGVTGGIVEGEGFEPSMTGVLIYLNGGDDLSVPLSKVEAAGGTIIPPKLQLAVMALWLILRIQKETKLLCTPWTKNAEQRQSLCLLFYSTSVNNEITIPNSFL